MVKTPFDLIQRLSAWFLRADRDIALPSGRKITITGANVEITSGNLVITGGNVTVSGTVDGVDISAHASNANAHHNQSHVLATTTALGGDHTVSGLTAGQVLRATGSSTARFQAIQSGDLPAIDHGGLSGLADDDHTQYYNATRHTKAVHDALGMDHGSLSGLTDDDHSQYHNNTRGDARYYQKSEFSSNPGAASSPLKSDSSGFLDLEGVGVGTYVSASERIAASGNLLIGGRGNFGAGLEVGGTGANPTAGRIVVAESSAPGTPSSGTAVMYFKTDGRLYTKDDGGTEYGPL